MSKQSVAGGSRQTPPRHSSSACPVVAFYFLSGILHAVMFARVYAGCRTDRGTEETTSKGRRRLHHEAWWMTALANREELRRRRRG